MTILYVTLNIKLRANFASWPSARSMAQRRTSQDTFNVEEFFFDSVSVFFDSFAGDNFLLGENGEKINV